MDWATTATGARISRAASLRMEDLSGGVLQSEHGDVVFLAELLGGFGDGVGGLGAYLSSAVEAEELALSALCFHHPVREEGQPVLGREPKRGFAVDHVGGNAERQAGIEGEFFAVPVRREVAGVGHCDLPIGSGIDAQTGGEAAHVALSEHT